MSTNIPNLIEEALSLPEDDRAGLVHRLLHSLQPPCILSENSTSLDDELNRRLEGYDAGESQASDFESVAGRIRQALEKRKSL